MRHRRLLIAAAVLLLLIALGVFLWLRSRPEPIPTRIPELTALVEKTQKDTEEAVVAYQPHHGRLDDLSVPVVDLLKQLPGVGKIEVLVAVDKPAQRIIHLADWHFVPKDIYDQDQESAHGRKLTEGEKDALYRQFLLETELVQVQQLAVIRCVAKHHGVKTVFSERLTKQGISAFNDRIVALEGIPTLQGQLRDVRLVTKTGVTHHFSRCGFFISYPFSR